MAKLSQLFDLNKIADNKELNSVIDDTHSRYSGAVELDDDMLQMVSGGLSDTTAPAVMHMCPNCNKECKFNLVSGGRAFCSVCGEQIII